MDKEAEVSLRYLLDNISPAGTAKGVVVASPSRANPDYYFHWIRDASLVMDTVVDLYRFSKRTSDKRLYSSMLSDFLALTRSNQLTRTLTGLGEPKFNVDGSAFNGPWGRPQNDGPALRAVALTKLAFQLIAEGQEAEVRRLLYDNKLPSASLIKVDLEYVSHNWQQSCFDLWEEINGHHFYTRMVQRKSMVEGARLAYKMGDRAAGDFYATQAKAMEREMPKFWNASGNFIVTTLGRTGGIDYKSSGIDSSVILGVLHGHVGDGFFGPSDDRVLATFQKVEEVFQKIYPVNSKGYPGVAIGRYPEDRYSGSTNVEGNPWFLTTTGFGELLHKAAAEFTRKGRIDINGVNQAFFKSIGVPATSRESLTSRDAKFQEILQKLRSRGDEYLSRAGFHTAKDGRMSEQINRHTGFMQSAHDLTWSYAAFITAYWSRIAR